MTRDRGLASARTIAYGPLPDQVGDLYLPTKAPCAVICLLHGGFWRMPYARDNIAPIAADLLDCGFAVWNLEYRRVGNGGGWPNTLQDVAMGIDHLAVLQLEEPGLDLTDVTTVGHSAGGHLALWSAQHEPSRNHGFGPAHVKIRRAVALAAVTDLIRAYELHCGNGAVADFIGGSPGEFEHRYRTSSPLEMLPTGVEQLLIHGTHDDVVPIELSRRYAVAARAAGDAVELIELEEAGHMDFVDPSTAASRAVRRWLTR